MPFAIVCKCLQLGQKQGVLGSFGARAKKDVPYLYNRLVFYQKKFAIRMQLYLDYVLVISEFFK